MFGGGSGVATSCCLQPCCQRLHPFCWVQGMCRLLMRACSSKVLLLLDCVSNDSGLAGV